MFELSAKEAMITNLSFGSKNTQAQKRDSTAKEIAPP